MATLSLGRAPANGRDAITQCLFFKTLMHNDIGRDPNGAWLHIAAPNGADGREMVVEYDPETPGALALAYAKAAEEHAEQVWEQVAGRQPTHEHVLRRARGM